MITDQTVDKVMQTFATEMGPFNGAKLVARAWTDDAFKALLVTDTMAAVAQLGLPTGAAGAEGEHMRAVANTPQVHNLIICTLCSCYLALGAGVAALLVQGPVLPCPCGQGAAGGAQGVRPGRRTREGDPHLGQLGPDPLVRRAERPDGTQGMSEDDLAKWSRRRR